MLFNAVEDIFVFDVVVVVVVLVDKVVMLLVEEVEVVANSVSSFGAKFVLLCDSSW